MHYMKLNKQKNDLYRHDQPNNARALAARTQFDSLSPSNRTCAPYSEFFTCALDVKIMQQDRNVSLFVVLVAASAATAGLIFGYDVAVMNGALVFLWAAFHLGRVETEMVPTVMLPGCAVGAALGGWLSDRDGEELRSSVQRSCSAPLR